MLKQPKDNIVESYLTPDQSAAITRRYNTIISHVKDSTYPPVRLNEKHAVFEDKHLRLQWIEHHMNQIVARKEEYRKKYPLLYLLPATFAHPKPLAPIRLHLSQELEIARYRGITMAEYSQLNAKGIFFTPEDWDSYRLRQEGIRVTAFIEAPGKPKI